MKTKKYDHILSLGKNCEAAFQFKRVFKFTESSIFNWAAIEDDEKFLQALDNLDLIFSDEIIEHDSVNMWQCKISRINFHGDRVPGELLDKNGKKSPEKTSEERENVKNRIVHLVQKLKAVWAEKSRQLYVVTVHKENSQEILEYVKRLTAILNRKTENFDLLVVIPDKKYDKRLRAYKAKHIYFRTLKHFSPWLEVTNLDKCDKDGWNKIYAEFAPAVIRTENKVYKFEKQSKNLKIKILTSYHKPALLLKNNIITPIHAGRAIAERPSKDGTMDGKAVEWLKANMIGDDTGENISAKNRNYNEATSIYWAWKNQDKLDNPDYIGFMHYRRQFIFNDKNRKNFEKYSFFAPDSEYAVPALQKNSLDKLFNEEEIKQAVNGYDIVAAKPVVYPQDVYEQYKAYSGHRIGDLDKTLDIIKEDFPEYYPSAELYIHSNLHHFWNMFIMKKETFDEYCRWMFAIFDKLEKQTDLSDRNVVQARVYAYLAERLTGIFITHHKNSCKIKYLYSIFEENTEDIQIKPAFAKNNVPVVFSSDDGYALYLGVCIKSLIVNSSPNYNYDIFILDGGISEYSKQRILDMQQKNVSIRFIEMKSFIQRYNLNIFKVHLQFTVATYYRFFLPEIFAAFDKVCYVDCDTIILKDIAELFQIDIGDCYLGCTHDMSILQNCFNNDKECDYYHNVLEMKDFKNYFQAGCLLCNLKKMREDDLTRQLIARLLKVKEPRYVDQCILNSVCEGKVHYIPQNWNYTWHIELSPKEADYCFPQSYLSQLEKAQKKTYIIHFTAVGCKPWLNPTLNRSHLFWHYARMTPFYEEILYKNLKVFPAPGNSYNPTDLNLLCDAFNYRKNRLKYLRYKLLSKITFGKLRKKYKRKKKELKQKLKQIRLILKSSK